MPDFGGMMGNRKAFTLVELLVVIAIVAVLMAILLPSMRGLRALGRRIQCGANLKNVAMGIGMYAQTYDDALLPRQYLSWGMLRSDGHPYRGYYSNRNYEGMEPIRLMALLDTGLVDQPAVFYCPSATSSNYSFENYKPWPTFNTSSSASGSRYIYSGYGYVPLGREYDDASPRMPKLAEKFSDLHPGHPFVTDLLSGLSSLHHTIEGRNLGVLTGWPDGHVNWSTNESAFARSLWWGSPSGDEDRHAAVMVRLEP